MSGNSSTPNDTQYIIVYIKKKKKMLVKIININLVNCSVVILLKTKCSYYCNELEIGEISYN